MKRRNAECGKLRRPVKRSKITEGIYGSTFLYLKFLLVWSLVLMADFIVEFRFEYLWPFWLLLRSVYDSFKYQGLAFSVFFVCIAVTSDVVCYLFIPVQWLFFAASTYVWVQYVWHTERGICLPTVSLWLLFVYVEASVRLRDFKGLPIHMDLCRPFAAHCIGYPVVTLGFGFKSYVSYRLRLRKQKDVQKENDFYMQLLQQALPPELQTSPENDKHKALPARSSTHEEGISNGNVPTGSSTSHSSSTPTSSAVATTVTQSSTTSTGGGTHSKKSSVTTSSKQLNSDAELTSATNNSTSSSTQKDLKKQNNVSSPGGGTPHIEDFMEQNLASGKRGNSTNVNSYEEENLTNEAHSIGKSYNKSNGVASSSAKSSSSASKLNSHNTTMTNAAATSSGSSKRSSSNKSNNNTANTGANFTNNKDESILRLEVDLKRIKSELQTSRSTEQELRSQMNSLLVDDKVTKSELYQLRRDNESLQTKLHNLVTNRQQDKQTMSSLERRLAEERKLRTTAEQQLAEKKKKEEAAAAAANSRAAAASAASATANCNRGECTDSCKLRRREAENEIKQSRRELKLYEDQIRQLERETQVLHQYKDAHNETEVLMSALSAMQEKMTHLETSLSAETRLKLDLFSALGDAKRQIEIQQGMMMQKDAQIAEFKSKIAEVMAVMPASSSPFTSPSVSADSPHFSSGFATHTPPPPTSPHSPSPRLSGVMGVVGASGTPPPHNSNGEQVEVISKSSLNPNASDYTPKLPQ